MTALTQIWSILRKDLLIELRSKELIVSMAVFSLVVVVVFNFAFDPGTMQLQNAAPGILWVALIFAGNIGLSRGFAREQENSSMQGLLLCPVERSLIYLAKVIGNMIFMGILQIIVLPLLVIFYDLSIGAALLPLILVLFLGMLGFAATGTLFSTIAAQTKTREVMLPVLLLPVSVPLILCATKSTAVLLNGGAFSHILSWIKILIAFDVIFFTLSWLLYEYVLEE